MFPDASTNANSVVESPGARVSTTCYGNRITYWPEQRGSRAFDGDLSTAWQVGTHAKAVGEKLRLDLDEPITTDHVNLVQRQVGDTLRSVTAVTLAFDGGDPVTVPLDDSSRAPDGQTVTFPSRSFRRLEVTIADTSGHDAVDGPQNNVGFAEIRVRDDARGATDVRVDEIVRMPTDLVRHAPRSTVAERPLVYVMTRSRNVVIPPRDSQDEMALVRKFLVPNDRAFSYRGRARLATDAPDDVLDSLLGLPDAEAGGITVTASQHLDGSVAARGSAALDGDPATAWNTKFGAPAGQWVEVRTPAPVTFDRVDLQVVADGRHSVPTQLRIDAGGESRTVDVPTVSDSTQENATATVPVTFAPLTGDDVRVTVTGVRPIVTTEYHELQPIVMPVGIAELGIPGVRRGPLPAALPDTCRTDLVALDGEPLPVRLDGSPADAQALQPVDLRACDGAPTAVDLAAGNHVVRSARGRDLGVDVDGLTLGSAAGGEPLVLGANGSFTPAPPSAGKGPSVRIVHNGRTKLELDVTGATPGDPFWLTLGQSQNAGWQATADGVDLGGSTLVDGYANGWRVTPTSAHFDVTLTWTPQRRVWIALGISAVALLLCLVLALRGLRHRRGTRESVAAAELPELTSPLVAAGDRPSVSALVAGTLTAGVLGAFLVRWWVGLVAAAAVLLVALRPRFRFLLTFGAPAALALSGLYVAVQQFRYEYVSDFGWPTYFERVHYLAWLAVILLASDAIVELVRTGWARPPSVPSADSVPAREPALPRDAASTPEPV